MPLKIIYLISGTALLSGTVTWAYMLGKANAQLACDAKVCAINKAIHDKEYIYQQKIAMLESDIITAVNNKEVQTEVKYEIRYKTKIKYIKANPELNVDVPNYWVQYLNASYSNTAMPIDATTATANGVNATTKIDTIADVASQNAELYYICKDRLEGLQDFIRKQVEIRGK